MVSCRTSASRRIFVSFSFMSLKCLIASSIAEGGIRCGSLLATSISAASACSRSSFFSLRSLPKYMRNRDGLWDTIVFNAAFAGACTYQSSSNDDKFISISTGTDLG